jgi:hypothetical protein
LPNDIKSITPLSAFIRFLSLLANPGRFQ